MVQCMMHSKRSLQQCKKWALRGRNTCHMHGGTSKGPKTKKGKEKARQAAFRHGGYTKEAKMFHQEAMKLIRQSKNIIQQLE